LARIGYADPGLATTASRQLLTLFYRVKQAEHLAEEAFDSTSGKQRDAFGKLSVHLGYIGDGVVGAAEVWRQVHPEVLEGATIESEEEREDG
jgi:hypothetical protein